MATLAQDNVVKAIGFDVRKLSFPLDNSGSNDFNQGDLLYWDSSAKVVKALVTDGNAATLAGVALKSSALSLYVNQTTGSAVKNYEPMALVGIGCIVRLKTTAAETLTHGLAVYAGADAQTVTTVAGSNPVGYVQLDQSQSSITGAAGVTVNVLLAVKSPVASL